MLVVASSLIAQEKTVVEVNGMRQQPQGAEGDLNTAIKAAINAGTLSNTIFKLRSCDIYPIVETIEVPLGQVLEITAPTVGATQESAPPQILWTASSSVTKNFFIAVYGDLIMKNIWVRHADVAGVQTGTPIVFEGDTASSASAPKQYGTFENCVIEWMNIGTTAAAGAICVRSKHFNASFINCFFRNCTDRHYMYYGRAVSFPFDVPNYHTEDISFENCTFTNMGYVYMQEKTDYADNVHFNHCTFYNIVMWPLEYGWWWKINVNNCLFVNAYMLGYIPFTKPTYDNSATVCITPLDSMTFSVPFTEQDRHILFTHSAYYMDDWLVDWMRGGWEKNYNNTLWRPDPRITSVGNPYSVDLYKQRLFDNIPYPRPMLDSTSLVYFDSTDAEGNKLYPYINRAALYDVTELRNLVNPRFVNPPIGASNLDSLKYFLYQKWDENKDAMWAFEIEAGFMQQWPLPENLAYANDTLKTAGMGGFPIGDLYHWWNPAIRAGATDRYTEWLAQADEEREKIAQWLDTGINPDSVKNAIKPQSESGLPAKFALSQNYPNPFNPTSVIKYSVPHTAWVSLRVYNLRGQEVMTLVDGIRIAGDHSVTLDGNSLAGGIYFYTLKSEGITITKKVILLK